jgi:O-antigen/teichoic acid export membrane protein
MGFASPIAQLVVGKASFAPYVRIVAATFLFSNLNEVPMAFWRSQGKTALFVSVGLVRTVLGASTLALFLAGLHWGVLGALYANLLTNGISGLTLTGIVLSVVPWRIARKRLEEMLRYGIPTVAWGLSAFVLTFSDRLFLRYFSNLSEVGTYALGYKLGAIVTVIVTGPFSMAWGWQQFELAKRENGKQIFARTQTYLLMICVVVGLSVSVMAKDILRILAPPSYAAAALFVPLITLTYILSAVREFVISGIYIQRTTIHLARIAVITVASNLVLNYLLISQFHAMGAAVATVLSFAIELVLCFVASQRVYPIQYEYGRSAIILGAAAVVYLVSLLPHLEIVASIGVNSFLLMLFGGIILVLMDSSERRALRQYVLNLVQQARRLTAQS